MTDELDITAHETPESKPPIERQWPTWVVHRYLHDWVCENGLELEQATENLEKRLAEIEAEGPTP